MTSTVSFGASVRFGTYGIRTPLSTPNTFEVSQKEFAHDLLTMTFWGGDVNSDALSSGEPVFAQWGNPPIVRDFYGYVNHAGRTNNSLMNTVDLVDRNATTVVCVGASWPMKQPGTQKWTGQTASQIVQSIANLFGLDADITPHNQIWPSLQMAGRSYWQFCCKLAKMIGYTFYCNGVQLVFKPRQTNPNALVSLAAVYDYKTDPASLPIFMPTIGTASPMGGQLRNRQLGGIDPRTSQLIYSQTSGSPTARNLGSFVGTPPFNQTEHFSVRSQAEADVKTQGAGLLNQLYNTACATGRGNPLVSQGSLIYVQNANGSQDGLWYVCEAKHSVNKQNYSMQLEVGRDSMGATVSLGITKSPSTAAQGVLVGTAWQAAA